MFQNERTKKYKLIKKNVSNWLKQNKEKLQNNGLEITERVDTSRAYIADFFNGDLLGGLDILRDYDYRPYDFVEFIVIGTIDDEDKTLYYFYDDENSTIDDIKKGIEKGIDYLIDHKS